MANIRLLISRYLDGDLADNEVAEMATALESDVASVDQLVFMALIHAQLLNWMDQHGELSESAGASVGVEPLAVDRSEPKSRVADAVRNRSNGARGFMIGARRRILSFGSLAALLLIAASLSIVAYVVSSRPTYVGQMTEATNCRWGSATAEMGVGTFLSTGQQIELLEGKAVITFANGAKLFLEGPTSLQLTSVSNIRLIAGRIAAKVPRQAVGFSVTSNLARIVDLGTQFSLSLQADKSFELHVFEGQVELRLDKRFGEAVHQPAYITAVHAVAFDVASADIKAIEFEHGKQMPF